MNASGRSGSSSATIPGAQSIEPRSGRRGPRRRALMIEDRKSRRKQAGGDAGQTDQQPRREGKERRARLGCGQRGYRLHQFRGFIDLHAALGESSGVSGDNPCSACLTSGLMKYRIFAIWEAQRQRRGKNLPPHRSDIEKRQERFYVLSGAGRADRLGNQIVKRCDRGGAQQPFDLFALHRHQEAGCALSMRHSVQQHIQHDVRVEEPVPPLPETPCA